MPTTARGYRYPASTDDVRPYEDIQFAVTDINDDITNTVLTAYPSALRPLWILTSTSASTAIGASSVEQTTAALTAASSTYKAHTAYEIEFRALVKAATTGGNLNIRMRDTNAAGTLRMDNVPALAVTTANQLFTLRHVVANTTGSDITSRVLCVTFQHSAAGGAQFNAASTLPWLVRCRPLGLDTDFTEAVAL